MKFSKHQIIDFAVLVLRWYLAFYMISYGWGKMTGGQFYVSPENLAKPLGEVNRFYLAWYLFSLSKVFNLVVGLAQVLGAVLLLFPRTVLIGALLLLPVLGQIFLVDLAFTTDMFGLALVVRLAGMMLADGLILWYHKDRMIAVWRTLTQGMKPAFRYPWALYLALPVLGFLTDFVLGLILYPAQCLLQVFFY